MYAGTLGKVLFTASRFRILTYSGMNRSGSVRIEEHAIIGAKPLLEWVGPDLESITLNIRLDAGLGVDPVKELEKLRGYRDNGDILPLLLGFHFEGNWCITDLDEEHKHTTGLGNLLVAEVSVTLKEAAYI